jgi:hypothetical protein
MVHGGVAEYLCIGDVDVQVVDEDNIDAGDPRVELDPVWEPYLEGAYNLPYSKYVYIRQPDDPAGAPAQNSQGQLGSVS